MPCDTGQGGARPIDYTQEIRQLQKEMAELRALLGMLSPELLLDMRRELAMSKLTEEDKVVLGLVPAPNRKPQGD